MDDQDEFIGVKNSAGESVITPGRNGEVPTFDSSLKIRFCNELGGDAVAEDVSDDLRQLVNMCIEQLLQLRFEKDKQAMLEHLDQVYRLLDEIREVVESTE